MGNYVSPLEIQKAAEEFVLKLGVGNRVRLLENLENLQDSSDAVIALKLALHKNLPKPDDLSGL